MWGPRTPHIHVAVESLPECDEARRPGTDRYSTLHIKLRRAHRSVLGNGVSVLGNGVAGKLKRDPAVRAPTTPDLGITLAACGLEELFFQLCCCVSFLVVAGNSFWCYLEY